MRVVETADRPPRKCLVTGREKGPLVDFQVNVDPPRPDIPHGLFLHKGIVEEAARKLGMVPADEVERLTEQLAGLSAELDELRGDMEVYAEFEERFKDRPLPTENRALQRSAA